MHTAPSLAISPEYYAILSFNELYQCIIDPETQWFSMHVHSTAIILQYRQKLAPAPHFQHCHFSAIHCSHNPFQKSGVQSVNFPHCYLHWGTVLCKCRLPQVRSPQTRAQKLLAPAPALAYTHIQSNGTPPTRPEGCKSLHLIRPQCLGLFVCKVFTSAVPGPHAKLQILLLLGAYGAADMRHFTTLHHAFNHVLYQTTCKFLNLTF